MASFSWPVITSANPSVGGTGAAAPSSATEVAGVDGSGDLVALSVDSTGALNVNIASGITNPLPVTDAAAEASLASLDTKTTVVNTDDVTVTSSALPTGAATEAKQDAQITQETAIATNTADTAGALADVIADTSQFHVIVNSSPLPTGAATEATLSALNAKVTTVNTGAVTVASSALPTGAATEATLAAQSAKLPSTLGQKTMANSLAVTLASDQGTIGIAQAGYARANAPVMNNYASSPVTTSAYSQIVLSTSSATKQVQIFDSSGQAMIFALGGVGAETDYLYVPPGGGVFNLAIASATRITIKALTANATSGYMLVNFLG